MKPNMILQGGHWFLVCVLIAVLAGCKVDEPPEVWNPVAQGGVPPTITSVSPPGAAWSKVSNITITGTNFESDCRVYMGSDTVPILSNSPTQLVVLPPPDTGSTFSIKVVNRDAYTFAVNSPYALYSISETAAKLIDSSDITAMDVDVSGNLYLAQLGRVFRVPPGQGQVLLGLTPDVPAATCLRINADGYLYMTNRASRTRIYRQDLTSGAEASYVNSTRNVNTFDFGPNGKTIYAGGNKALVVIDSALKVTVTSYYPSNYIQVLRVFNGYLYAGLMTSPPSVGGSPVGIWRNKINDDGSLAASEEYFNWTNAPAPAAVINDITFSAAGDLYVATNGAYPIVIVHQDKTAGYLYPGALDSPINLFVWGSNVPYLYVNYLKVGGKRTGRLTMDANLQPLNISPILGAPYYGRGS